MKVRGLVELLVVIDAEGKSALAHRSASSGRLRREEARGYRRGYEVGAEAANHGNLRAEGIAGNLGVMPVDGEGDRRVAQDAEVEGVVGVLPDVLAADHGMLSEALLQAGVELVAETGLKRSRNARRAEEQRRQHRIRASLLDSTRFSLNGVSRVRA